MASHCNSQKVAWYGIMINQFQYHGELRHPRTPGASWSIHTAFVMRLRLGFLQYCYRSTQQCIAAEIALERCAGRLGDGMSLGWVEVEDDMLFLLQWSNGNKVVSPGFATWTSSSSSSSGCMLICLGGVKCFGIFWNRFGKEQSHDMHHTRDFPNQTRLRYIAISV